jgi:hypothetical protein
MQALIHFGRIRCCGSTTTSATGNNSALRINFHTDDLANHRDFYYGERVGFNPTLKVLVSDKTTLDLSYEYADS